MADSILLGHAPRPTDGAQLAKRIRTFVIASEPAGIPCTAQIDAELDGPDIARLDIDLTGFVLANELERDRAHTEPQGAVVDSEQGVLRDLRVRANPMRVQGAPVTIDAVLADVGFHWLVTDHGELAVAPVEPSEERPLVGRARVSLPAASIGPVIQGLAEAELMAHGVSVSKLDLQVEQAGPRGVRITGEAKVRKGLLGASVRGSATAEIDDRMGLTLSQLSLGSANPLVQAMLAAFSGKVASLEGRRIDLTRDLPPGVHLRDVQVQVGDDVVLEAQLG